MLEVEEESQVRQQRDLFKQMVIVSPLRIFDPYLYTRLFEPENLPPEALPEEEPEASGVFFPTSDEDFDLMIEEVERAEAQRRVSGRQG